MSMANRMAVNPWASRAKSMAHCNPEKNVFLVNIMSFFLLCGDCFHLLLYETAGRSSCRKRADFLQIIIRQSRGKSEAKEGRKISHDQDIFFLPSAADFEYAHPVPDAFV
jgi:hypothetical protein